MQSLLEIETSDLGQDPGIKNWDTLCGQGSNSLRHMTTLILLHSASHLAPLNSGICLYFLISEGKGEYMEVLGTWAFSLESNYGISVTTKPGSSYINSSDSLLKGRMNMVLSVRFPSTWLNWCLFDVSSIHARKKEFKFVRHSVLKWLFFWDHFEFHSLNIHPSCLFWGKKDGVVILSYIIKA